MINDTEMIVDDGTLKAGTTMYRAASFDGF